jgi:hypothetical protein
MITLEQFQDLSEINKQNMKTYKICLSNENFIYLKSETFNIDESGRIWFINGKDENIVVVAIFADWQGCIDTNMCCNVDEFGNCLCSK